MHQTDNALTLNRRRFLQASAAASAGLLLSACVMPSPATPAEPAAPTAPALAEESGGQAGEGTTPANTPVLEPTPACDDGDETLAQTEGPYYTPNTPERTNLREEGMGGTPLLVRGRVLGVNCEPIAGALLDFWHADDAGIYDNVGFRLCGHQFTDTEGNYRLETILPGLYPGRTRHIHVKVQGPDTALLTTQLYFPGEPANERDGIYHPSLLMTVNEADAGKEAFFDFVLG